MEVNKDIENIIPSSEGSIDISKPTINEEFSTEIDSAEIDSAEKKAVKIEIENDVILNTADVSGEITKKTDKSNKKKVKKMSKKEAEGKKG